MEIKVQESQEMMEHFEKWLAEPRYTNLLTQTSPDKYGEVYFAETWHTHCQILLDLRFTEYSLNRDAARLRQAIEEICELYVPLYKYVKWGSQYENSFALPFLLYVAMEPRERIVALCRETDHDDAREPIKWRGAPMTLVRVLRAWFLQEPAWLRQELDAFDKVLGGDLPTAFDMRKKKWRELMEPLLAADAPAFERVAKDLTRWYHKRVEKCHRTIDGTYYSFHEMLNYPMLACLKIANSYQGMNVKIEDEFIPLNLIHWG